MKIDTTTRSLRGVRTVFVLLAIASVALVALSPATLGAPPGNIQFKIDPVSKRAGRGFETIFSIRADQPFNGFEFSVDLDEGVVRSTGIVNIWERPGGEAFDFEAFQIDNDDETPGSGGVDEGFVAGRAVFSPAGAADVLPANEDVPVLAFQCHLDANASPGETQLRFVDGATGFGITFENQVIAGGQSITPATASQFVFINGAVTIEPPGPFFIRGDSNSDGQLTIADSHFTLNYLFRGTVKFSCFESADANGDERIDLSDPIRVLSYLYLGSNEPPVSPFPDPGIDTRDNHLDCVATGTGAPLEDPAARLEIADVTAGGGESAKAVITIRMSSSTEIGALALSLSSGAPIFTPGEGLLEDPLELPDEGTGFDVVRTEENRLTFAYLPSLHRNVSLPAGEGIDVARLHFCLAPGTPAGEYALTLESGELADHVSGQSIFPELAGGTLTILEDVSASPCQLTPPTEPPTEPPKNIEFKIGSASGGRGDSVGLPFTILADRPSQGFEFSVDFDEEVLEATDIVKRWQRPGGTSYDFEVFEFNNDNRVPGSEGIDEGFLVGAAIISLTDSESVLPPDNEVEVLRFVFTIDTEAPPGETPVPFLDGAVGSGEAVANKLIAGGEHITPDLADSFVFVNGLVNILPDGAIFIRGDSDGNRALNIADPIHTLDYLFKGGMAPFCLDAADSNDDGRIDITDPISTLDFLFRSTFVLPPPRERPGTDPTPDGLSCTG